MSVSNEPSITMTDDRADHAAESPIHARYDNLFSDSFLTEAGEWVTNSAEEIAGFLYQEFVPSIKQSQEQYHDLEVQRFNALSRIEKIIKRFLGWKKPRVSGYIELDMEMVTRCERFAARAEMLQALEPYRGHDMRPYIDKPRMVAALLSQSLQRSDCA